MDLLIFYIFWQKSPFNCWKCIVFKLRISHKTRTFSHFFIASKFIRWPRSRLAWLALYLQAFHADRNDRFCYLSYTSPAVLQQVKFLPFHVPEALKRHRFRAEPLRIDNREYPSLGLRSRAGVRLPSTRQWPDSKDQEKVKLRFGEMISSHGSTTKKVAYALKTVKQCQWRRFILPLLVLLINSRFTVKVMKSCSLVPTENNGTYFSLASL